MGIFMAVPIVVYGRADIMSLPPAMQFTQWLGVLILVALAFWLYKTATTPDKRPTAAASQT